MNHSKPVQKDGRVVTAEWSVDIQALRRVNNNRWLVNSIQLLERDLREMKESFPRWYLVAGSNSSPIACPYDGEYIVPKDGAMRCLLCGHEKTTQVNNLIWTGFLPIPLTGAKRVLARFRKRLEDNEPTLPFLDKNGSTFLFTPINVVYSPNWPNEKPACFYASNLFWKSMGTAMPSFGHENHMYNGSQMCLFADWTQMSIREVLQNRVLPHALAHVKIANGERPKSWFN